jgi:WbqC-like protein
MQPYLFPYIGYFQLIHAVDRFVVYDDVAYIKQGWINRNRILINGEPSFFSVPIKHASSYALICDTFIDDDPQHARWVEKLLKTFDNAYRRAPEFRRVFPIVERVFSVNTTRIADLALASVKAISSLLEIETTFVDSSRTYGNATLRGENRVLSICQAERANEYINVPGGRDLYSRERFEAAGIGLSFIQPRNVEYPQFGGPFVQGLSIIDVLMFNPLDQVRRDLDAYDLA